jgi:hypothetical protein
MVDNTKIQVADAFKHLDPNQKLAENISAGFSRVVFKGKTWALMHQGTKHLFVRKDDGTPLPYLDVIFIGVNPQNSKMYYEGTYVEDSQEAPDCTSVDGSVPDPGCPSPQAQSCAICPHNQWLPNRQGKECQDHRRVAILLLPTMATMPPLEAPLLEGVFFKVPPASLKTFKSYSDQLNHRGAHFASVITRISFDPNKQFQMNFTFLQPLTNAEAPLVLPMLEDPQVRELIGTAPRVQMLAKPEPKRDDGPVDTGLLGAFAAAGGAVKDGEIQPPKRQQRRPKLVEAVAEPQQHDSDGGEGDPEESDPNLDDAVKNALGKKLSDMLK